MRRVGVFVAIWCFVCLSLSPLQTRAAQGASYTFLTIDPPFSGVVNTDAKSINNGGAVVGQFYGPTFTGRSLHGWLRDPNGVFTQIDIPFAGTFGTRALGINDSGIIVGGYNVAPGDIHGFLLRSLLFTRIDFPGAAISRCVRINNLNQIIGQYGPTIATSWLHGFLLSNGTFTDITFPGAASGYTLSIGLNDKGQIVGSYGTSPGGFSHGFSLVAGVYRSIDFPGASQTWINGINNFGQIVGTYVDGQNFIRGFLLQGTTFTTIDLPGVPQNTNGMSFATFNDNADIRDINDGGQISGQFLGSDGRLHGFIGTPVIPFAAFDANSEVNLKAGAVHVNGTFTLGSTSKEINPVIDPVTIGVGTFTATIPAGSFRATGQGGWLFFGTISGVGLNVKITPRPSPTFEINLQATGANLAGTTSPTTVVLRIGQNSGSTVARTHLQ